MTIIETQTGHNYYFDHIQKQWLLLNPTFLYFIKTKIENQIFPTNEKHQKRISQLMKYYNNKYNFLSSHNYFDNLDKSNLFKLELTANDINYNLANTPQVVFEVTENCNLSCKYCGYGELYQKGINRSNRNLSFENAKALIDYLSGLWNSNYYHSYNRGIEIGFYGGEPLINMNFIKQVVDLCSHISLNDDYFKFNITTNGILLDKHIEFLVNNNFTIKISLDGDFINNGYRITKNGENSFDKVFQNIKYIQKKFSDFFNTNVHFNSVLHNKNSAKEIHTFFSTNFQKLPAVLPLNNSGILESKKDEFWEMYRNYNQSVSESGDSTIDIDFFTSSPKILDLSLFVHSEIGYNYTNYINLLKDQSFLREIQTGTCLPFGKKIYLRANGEILPCERIDHIFSLGRVEKGRVHLDFNLVAKKYNAYYKKLRSQCISCYIHSSCKQCLFYIPNINIKNPICRSYKNIQAYKNYLDEMVNEIEKDKKTYVRIKKEIFNN